MWSEREALILDILGNKKMTVKDITVKVFMHNDQPIDAVQTINNSIRRINLKCHYHGLSWKLEKIKAIVRKVKV